MECGWEGTLSDLRDSGLAMIVLEAGVIPGCKRGVTISSPRSDRYFGYA